MSLIKLLVYVFETYSIVPVCKLKNGRGKKEINMLEEMSVWRSSSVSVLTWLT